MGVQDLRRVASVLEEVITEFGRRLIEDPRRLKGLLTDTLGSDASALREAIEAVVAAAEAGIPQHALEGVDREEMISTLEGLLADPASAPEVVDIWMSALRVQDQTPTDGATVRAPFGIADVSPDLDPTALSPAAADDEATLLPKAGAPTSPPADRPGLKGRVTALAGQRKVAVASVAGLLVLALGGIGAASMFDNAPATPPTTEAPATTTTSGATTTTAVPVTELEHKEVMSWGVTVDRRWELVDGQLFMSVAIESGGEAVGGYLWEFFPESLGQDASAVASRLYPDTQQTETSLALDIPDIVTAVYASQEVMALVLELPARTTWTIEYSIPLPAVALDDPAFLESLLTEWESMRADFLASPPPALEVAAEKPSGGEVTIRGTATPGVEVEIDGKSVQIGSDGAFAQAIKVGAGETVVRVSAFDRLRGMVSTEELVIGGPGTTTSTTSTTKPPTPKSTTTTTTSTTTTTTATTTTQPANKAPTTACGSQYVNLGGVYANYWVNVQKSCFADADGQVVAAFATQPSYGSITAGNSNCTGAVWCWTYTPYSGWDGSAYEDTFQVRGQDDDGAYSPYISVTLCINC